MTTATILHDITLRDEPEQIVFGGARLSVTIGKTHGAWRALTTEGIDGNLLAATSSPGVALRVGDEEAKGAAKLTGWATRVANDAASASLDVSLAVGDGYELVVTYTLFPGTARLDRSARVTRRAGGPDDVRFEGFVFTLPGLALGDPAHCVVDVPGPWWPKTWVRPGTAYAALTDKRIGFHSAPDAGFGVLALTNATKNRAMALWMDTGGRTNYHPSLRGEDGRLTFSFHDHREHRLHANQTVASDVQRLEIVTGPTEAALRLYSLWCQRTLPLDPLTPAWAREAVILEVFPEYYKGGLKELASRLPFYREVGFNTLYLMPHWKGGYSPIDLFMVEPSVGTAGDLKGLVKEAHRLGMRVLFDMVIHGFNTKSPVVTERPDLFFKDEEGKIVPHPTWGSLSTDWANPAYHKYMADLVRHDLREYDIDGYRVDAASFKGPNWDPAIPYPAYRSGTDVPALMKTMLDALRETKPEAVLLSEVFGPVFYTVSNLGHDNQTEAPTDFLEKLDKGEASAQDYKNHVAAVYDLLPPGANRAFYARNHDTSWFFRFDGYTPRFLAFDAVHALVAIPEVFAGDPKNGPHPDEPGVYDYYKKLFAARKAFPELATGALDLRGVESENRQVFTALRRANGQTALAAVSLSDRPEEVRLRVGGSAVRAADLHDLQTGRTVAVHDGRATLAPFQTLVGRV